MKNIRTSCLPGGTLFRFSGWKNFVWCLFWATINRNLGFQSSSRNLQA